MITACFCTTCLRVEFLVFKRLQLGNEGMADSLANTSLIPLFKHLHLSQPHKRPEQSGGNRSQRAVQASATPQSSKDLLLYLCAASHSALWWCGSLSRFWASHQKILYIWKMYEEIRDDAHMRENCAHLTRLCSIDTFDSDNLISEDYPINFKFHERYWISNATSVNFLLTSLISPMLVVPQVNRS